MSQMLDLEPLITCQAGPVQPPHEHAQSVVGGDAHKYVLVGAFVNEIARTDQRVRGEEDSRDVQERSGTREQPHSRVPSRRPCTE